MPQIKLLVYECYIQSYRLPVKNPFNFRRTFICGCRNEIHEMLVVICIICQRHMMLENVGNTPQKCQCVDVATHRIYAFCKNIPRKHFSNGIFNFKIFILKNYLQFLAVDPFSCLVDIVYK